MTRTMPKQKPYRSEQTVVTPMEFVMAVERKLGLNDSYIDLAATRKHLLALFMLVVAQGMNWRVDFNADTENVGVVVTTECKGKTPFFAYDRYDFVDNSIETITMRRQPTPKGERCTVQASIMRAPDDNPEHEYMGESVIVIQED